MMYFPCHTDLTAHAHLISRLGLRDTHGKLVRSSMSIHNVF